MISEPQHHHHPAEMYARGYIWMPPRDPEGVFPGAVVQTAEKRVRGLGSREEAEQYLAAYRIMVGRAPDTGELR